MIYWILEWFSVSDFKEVPSFIHSCQLWINPRVNYPFYDLSILPPPSPSFHLPAGYFPIRWHLSHGLEKELMLDEMKNASMKSWKVLELIFLFESRLACNHFYVISIHISQKRSMRRIFIQIRTISQWVKQASQLLKIIPHNWNYEKTIRGHVFPYTCVEKLLSNFRNHFMYKGK